LEPTDLACTAWAFAKLGIVHEPLMDALSASSLSNLSEFTPPRMASIAWACATLSVNHKPLIAAIASAAIRKIGQFEPTSLANLAWAYARWLFQAFPNPGSAHSVLWGTL